MQSNLKFFKKFLKITQLKRVSIVTKVNRISNYRNEMNFQMQRMLKTINQFPTRNIQNNALFVSKDNKKVDTKMVIVVVESFTDNSYLIKILENKLKEGDYVVVTGITKEISNKFVKELYETDLNKMHINFIASAEYAPNYEYAIFLESIVRQHFLINKTVSEIYLLTKTADGHPLTKIIPMYEDEAHKFEEEVNGYVGNEELVKNFNYSQKKWLDLSVTKLFILKIIVKLLQKTIDEINYEIITINKNIELVEEKIVEIVMEERKAKRDSALSEMNIFLG